MKKMNGDNTFAAYGHVEFYHHFLFFAVLDVPLCH